jgi:hypothetical protein
MEQNLKRSDTLIVIVADKKFILHNFVMYPLTVTLEWEESKAPMDVSWIVPL